MAWQSMPFEELSADVRERYLAREAMFTAKVQLDGFGVGQSAVSFSVPERSALRARPGAAPVVPSEVYGRLADSIDSATVVALQKLMVEAGRLPTPKEEQPAGAPALDLDLLFYDFGADNAEVRLNMPNPLVFRRALAESGSLQALAGDIARTVSREVRPALHAEVVDRALLSR